MRRFLSLVALVSIVCGLCNEVVAVGKGRVGTMDAGDAAAQGVREVSQAGAGWTSDNDDPAYEHRGGLSEFPTPVDGESGAPHLQVNDDVQAGGTDGKANIPDISLSPDEPERREDGSESTDAPEAAGGDSTDSTDTADGSADSENADAAGTSSDPPPNVVDRNYAM